MKSELDIKIDDTIVECPHCQCENDISTLSGWQEGTNDFECQYCGKEITIEIEVEINIR